MFYNLKNIVAIYDLDGNRTLTTFKDINASIETALQDGVDQPLAQSLFNTNKIAILAFQNCMPLPAQFPCMHATRVWSFVLCTKDSPNDKVEVVDGFALGTNENDSFLQKAYHAILCKKPDRCEKYIFENKDEMLNEFCRICFNTVSTYSNPKENRLEEFRNNLINYRAKFGDSSNNIEQTSEIEK